MATRAPRRTIKADWQGMMFDYLRGRPTLRRVLLLLDARIELKQADHDVMDLLDRAAVTFQIVLTKADGLKPACPRAQDAGGEATGAVASGGIPARAGDQQRNRRGHSRTAGGTGNTSWFRGRQWQRKQGELPRDS